MTDSESHSAHTDDLTSQIKDLQAELAMIQARNIRVEVDKAWEQSRSRILFLLIITYFVASLVFLALGAAAPLMNACIPTVGFLISTLSLPSAKRVWVDRYFTKRR